MPWFVRHTRFVHARARLVCVPHAGASAAAFHGWHEDLPPDIELCAVELPGRGARFHEPPLTRIDDVVGGLLAALRALAPRPTLLFGHSAGALIAWELAQQIEATRGQQLLHLFVSAAAAPHRAPRHEKLHALARPELLCWLRSLEGTPHSVVENDEMMNLLEPALRADLKLADDYRYTAGTSLACPISVFGGTRDRLVASDQLEAWHELTPKPGVMRVFDAGHFYLEAQRSEILDCIAASI